MIMRRLRAWWKRRLSWITRPQTLVYRREDRTWWTMAPVTCAGAFASLARGGDWQFQQVKKGASGRWSRLDEIWKTASPKGWVPIRTYGKMVPYWHKRLRDIPLTLEEIFNGRRTKRG